MNLQTIYHIQLSLHSKRNLNENVFAKIWIIHLFNASFLYIIPWHWHTFFYASIEQYIFLSLKILCLIWKCRVGHLSHLNHSITHLKYLKNGLHPLKVRRLIMLFSHMNLLFTHFESERCDWIFLEAFGNARVATCYLVK